MEWAMSEERDWLEDAKDAAAPVLILLVAALVAAIIWAMYTSARCLAAERAATAAYVTEHCKLTKIRVDARGFEVKCYDCADGVEREVPLH